MKTPLHSVFTDQIQGKPAPAPRRGVVLTAVLAALLSVPTGLPLPLPSALAGGGSSEYGPPPSSYGPPPELPPGSQVDDDASRRDIHMGNVDHMRMGRDDDGNVVMEVRPRPKQTQDQQQVGPFYIYPQIGSPGQMMGGQTATGQSSTGQTGFTVNGGGAMQGQPGAPVQSQPGSGPRGTGS